MRFVVDGLLGGLTRWLRMLGYVTDYDSKADDNSLLESSNSKEAILLTRDEELYNRARARNVQAVLVRGERDEIRLAQLAKVLGVSLNIDMGVTRCPECGSSLHEITRQEASSSVPPASLRLYERFWKCDSSLCAKTYWVGSHWKQLRHTLEEAQKLSIRDT